MGSEAAGGRIGRARPAMRSPGRPPVGRRGASAAVLGGDRARAVERGRRGARRACRRPVGVRWFREGGGMPSVTLAPAVGAVPVVRRARGDRAPARPGLRGARDRPSARPVAVDDLAGAAPQRRDPQRPAGVPGHDGAVACRPARPAPEARQARRQPRSCAATCRTAWPATVAAPGRDAGARARRCAWIGRRHGRAQGPALGDGRGARSRSPTGCALDFPDDESMRDLARGDLPVALRAGPRRAAARADRVPAHRPGAARPAGARPRPRQEASSPTRS